MTKHCSAGDCARPVVAKGMCNTHYQRMRVNGTLVLRRRRKGTGHIDGHGYRLLWRPGHPNARKAGHVPEHILVMTEALGRPLRKGETVHHKNGVRDDNRLANLELWASAHPPGQRISDQIAWALDLLTTYADDTALLADDVVERATALFERLKGDTP